MQQTTIKNIMLRIIETANAGEVILDSEISGERLAQIDHQSNG